MNRRSFEKAYVLAREAIIDGEDIKKDEFLLNNFYRVVIDSFRKNVALAWRRQLPSTL
jgi:hypothetical protein